MKLYLFLIVAYTSLFYIPLHSASLPEAKLLTLVPKKQSKLHKFFSCFFGSEALPQKQEIYFDQAATNFELKENQKPLIRYICASKFHDSYLNQFAHFTWFGTWVNKLAWTRMNDEEKQWAAHHETAHTALYHPQKQIVSALAVAISTTLLIKILNLKLPSLLLIPAALAISIPYYARYCEKEADIKAAQVLSQFNGKDTVENHIKSLEQQNDEWSPWFYKSSEQIKYLSQVLSKEDF